MNWANAIMHLMDNFQERIIMGVNARRCAEEQFDRNKVTKNSKPYFELKIYQNNKEYE